MTSLFRGKGVGIKETEKSQYHPDVHVLWQESAWLGMARALKWAQKATSPFVAATYAGGPCLLQHNLGAQRSKSYVEALTKLGSHVIYGPPNATAGWQPVDRGGIGALPKALIGDQQECWLEQTGPEDEPNWKRWEQGMSMPDKRIFLAWWAGPPCVIMIVMMLML